MIVYSHKTNREFCECFPFWCEGQPLFRWTAEEGHVWEEPLAHSSSRTRFYHDLIAVKYTPLCFCDNNDMLVHWAASLASGIHIATELSTDEAGDSVWAQLFDERHFLFFSCRVVWSAEYIKINKKNMLFCFSVVMLCLVTVLYSAW